MTNETTVIVPPELSRGQKLARMDTYGPDCPFYNVLVGFAETADILYTRLALSKNRNTNFQIRAALTKLSLAIDWTITVLKKDIISYD